MSSGSNPAKPRLACEIASDRVLAGRLADNGDMVEMCAARELTPGSVVADLVETICVSVALCVPRLNRRWAV